MTSYRRRKMWGKMERELKLLRLSLGDYTHGNPINQIRKEWRRDTGQVGEGKIKRQKPPLDIFEGALRFQEP